jgi:hypothetical protein
MIRRHLLTPQNPDVTSTLTPSVVHVLEHLARCIWSYSTRKPSTALCRCSVGLLMGGGCLNSCRIAWRSSLAV